MEQFQRNPSEMLRKIKHLEEFCDVTPVSGDGDRIRAHKVVLAFYHPDKDCESHMSGNVCGNKECEKRHRLICKY